MSVTPCACASPRVCGSVCVPACACRGRGRGCAGARVGDTWACGSGGDGCDAGPGAVARPRPRSWHQGQAGPWVTRTPRQGPGDPAWEDALGAQLWGLRGVDRGWPGVWGQALGRRAASPSPRGGTGGPGGSLPRMSGRSPSCTRTSLEKSGKQGSVSTGDEALSREQVCPHDHNARSHAIAHGEIRRAG